MLQVTVGAVIAVAVIIGVGVAATSQIDDHSRRILPAGGADVTYYIANPDTINDRAYWSDPFTTLPAYRSGHAFYGSDAWLNRHVFADILTQCQCPLINDAAGNADPGRACIGWLLGGMLDGDLDYEQTRSINTRNDYPYCQAPDPVFPDFSSDDFDSLDFFTGGPFLTGLDTCRLGYIYLVDPRQNFCMTDNGRTISASNPAAVKPLVRSDYIIPHTAEGAASEYDDIREHVARQNMGAYVLGALVVLALAALAVMYALRRSDIL